MPLRAKIAELRKEIGLNQRELALKIGVHLQSVWRWEKGETTPEIDDVKKLAELFRVTTDYLIFDNVPRDGRVDISDPQLLRQFEKADGLNEQQREVVKQLIDAFILKANIQKDIKESETKAKAKR